MNLEDFGAACELAERLKIYEAGKLPTVHEAKDALDKLEALIGDGLVRVTDSDLNIDQLRARIAKDLDEQVL